MTTVLNDQSAILKSLLQNKGQFRTIVTRRLVKFKKEFKNEPPVYKEVAQQVRCGVNYNNISNVSEARDNGDLPEKNAGFKGKEWVIFPYLLKNDAGDLFFRFYKVMSMANKKPKYFSGNKEISLDEIKGKVYASEIRERSNPAMAFEVNIKNIIELR